MPIPNDLPTAIAMLALLWGALIVLNLLAERDLRRREAEEHELLVISESSSTQQGGQR